MQGEERRQNGYIHTQDNHRHKAQLGLGTQVTQIRGGADNQDKEEHDYKIKQDTTKTNSMTEITK